MSNGGDRRRRYTDWLTPIGEHFVYQQDGLPDVDLDAEEWRVSLGGDLEAADVTVATLRESYPTVAVAHTMECAGNCRAYFEPTTGSIQWGIGGASTAVWTGVPVRAVLERHGLGAGADGDGRWLTAVGADEPGGDTVFARSIPLSKALDDCVLAYGMNGESLPEAHGRPVRLVVPGWYGVNSVKWLTELRVMDGMVAGESWADRDGRDYTYWQQEEYRITPPGEAPTEHTDVDTYDTWEQLMGETVDHPYPFDANVMSVVGYPRGGSTVQPREDGYVEVLGLAWAGDDAVECVEVSTDGGDTWHEATFLGPDYPGAWRLFRYLWTPDSGTHTVVSRATDEQGRTQPAWISGPVDSFDAIDDDEYPWNEGGFGANAYMPHSARVRVRPAE
ncbi:molybdopterin-dependent oxidoreductase [Halospeciosus flavus]|uniref:Molybdopterin-dependent oxidoreductase n=1 Tax=Halospeciosus flavus TaxID=3032283 RepID=A0ABD5Z0B9_9EURY|nr:molybdopterin-dependent oxidoreductase [Halospeciosus flavus]